MTSPLDVPVTVLLGDAPLTGTQFVLLVAELDAPAVVEDDIPLDVLGLVTLPLADADAPILAESLDVAGVAPVPLAPLVVFRPVKRCSGFVAVLRAESVAAPVVPAAEPLTDAEPGLIVVVAE